MLQGGTQNNMAVVKAEVDFIRSSFRSGDRKPEIIVHEHCGESGAIGAAVEARRLYRNGRRTSFIGLDAVRNITYRTTRNEEYALLLLQEQLPAHLYRRQHRRCARRTNWSSIGKVVKSKVPLQAGEQRLIIATCEKGTVEEMEDMKDIKAGLDAAKKNYPNFVDLAAHEAFRSRKTKSVADPIPSRAWTRSTKDRVALMKNRPNLRIGIPRLLNAYVYAPLFNAYFESLGLKAENLDLLRLHQSGAVSCRSQPRSHRPVFPGQNRHRSRPQPAHHQSREEAARCDLLRDGGRAPHAAGQSDGLERLPHGDGVSGDRESRVHQGERCLRRK